MAGVPYKPRRFLLVRDQMARRRRRAFLVSFAVLVAISIGLVAWQGRLQPALETVRLRAIEWSAPVLRASRALARHAQAAWSSTGSSLQDQAQIARLRRRVAELEVWRIRADQLENKLAELGRLAEVVTKPKLEFLTADVIGIGSDPRRLQIMIGAGADHGVKVGYPVIEAAGLVGVVDGVGGRAALVRLIEDVGFTSGALIGTGRVPARLRGRGGGGLSITLPEWNRRQIGPGDLVVTSGDGGRLPRGLRVGRVEKVGRDLVVRPFAAAERRRFVSVLKFQSIAIATGDHDADRTRTGGSPSPNERKALESRQGTSSGTAKTDGGRL